MRIIEQDAVLMDQTTPENAYKHIEKIGRTCYKSEDRITENSAEDFCLQMKKSKHYAMLEHYMIHMRMIDEFSTELKWFVEDSLQIQNYFIMDPVPSDKIHETWVSGSFRAFLEILDLASDTAGVCIKMIYSALANQFPAMFGITKAYDLGSVKVLSDKEFIDEVEQLPFDSPNFKYGIIRRHITHTVRFTTDRGVTHEMVRHRPASFAQESTRYCNYSKGKFGNEITVIKPCFYEEGSELYDLWRIGCEDDEINYFKLLAAGATAQQARNNLPTSVKADLIVTATEFEWQHIIDLRYYGTTGAPHPQMKELMGLAYPLLVEASNTRLK